jgi:hypothetical protein
MGRAINGPVVDLNVNGVASGVMPSNNEIPDAF